MRQPAVFLDRDGTLMEDTGYIGDPALVAVFPGVADALRRLKVAGYQLIIVTNQSGIGRGKFTPADFEAVQARLFTELGPDLIDATVMCPDPADIKSARRKPSPAMLLEAAEERSLDLARSWMIGDKDIDVQCGLRAGARSILVLTGQGDASAAEGAAFVARHLSEAADFILKADPPPPSAR